MHSLVGFAVFGVDWQLLKPYIVFGLALGGVYALSGVGIVVLYQTTGVLNVAFGAVGAAGALIAYWMIHHTGCPTGSPTSPASRSVGSSTLLYGVVFGPAFAKRDPLVKMMGTLGARADPARPDGVARAGGRGVRALPASAHARSPLGDRRRERQPDADHSRSRSRSPSRPGRQRSCARRSLGTAYRAVANDREITATLGVPVRRVEASAWFGSGIVCGAAGLVLADLSPRSTTSALTFLVISSLAAALIGRLRSLWATLAGGLAVGLVQAVLTPYASVAAYRAATPFVLAIIALLWLSRTRVVTISRTT